MSTCHFCGVVESEESPCDDCRRAMYRGVSPADLVVPASRREQRRRTRRLPRSQLAIEGSFVALKRHFGRRCAWCNACYEPAPSLRDVVLTRDHILPVSKGGGGVRANIVPACKDCNNRRGDKHPITWWLESGFKLRAVTAEAIVHILTLFPDWIE